MKKMKADIAPDKRGCNIENALNASIIVHWDILANSADPIKLHFVASDLAVNCLWRSILWDTNKALMG